MVAVHEKPCRNTRPRAATLTAALRHDGGLTLPEVLCAMAVITIGLLGVAGALMVSNSTGGATAGITGGQAAIERGNAMSTAVTLAQERLEQVKRLQYRIAPATPVDNIGTTPGPPTGFADEGYGSFTTLPNYKREVRVKASTPASNMKTVTVTVTVRFSGTQATAGRLSEERVSLATIIAARP